jgi:transcription-repair coupling factor (superfamily II helicase)
MDRLVSAIGGHDKVSVIGLQGSSGAYVLSSLLKQMPGMLAVLVKDIQRAETLKRDIEFYTHSGPDVAVFPSWEVLPFDQASPYMRLQSRRIEILQTLLTGSPPQVVIIPVGAWMTRLAPGNWLRHQVLSLEAGQAVRMEKVVRFLEGRGYQRVPLVEEPGDYSIRGGILDIFPSRMDMPVRLEFVGDGIASMRSFSVDAQRSTGKRQGAEILPVREIPWSGEERRRALQRISSRLPGADGGNLTGLLENISQGVVFPGMEFLLPLFHEELQTLMSYLPENCVLVLDNPDVLEEGWCRLWSLAEERSKEASSPIAQLISPEELYISPDEMAGILGKRKRLELKGLHVQKLDEVPSQIVQFPASSHAGLRSELARAPLIGETLGRLPAKFKQWIREGLSVHWVFQSRGQAERVREHLAVSGLMCRIEENTSMDLTMQSRVWIHVGELSQGFLSSSLGVAFLTEEEVFGPRRIHRPPRSARKLPAITHLEDLQEGDLVVHMEHGIGIYRGLKTLEIGNVKGDFIHLEYMGQDRLYVPVDRFQCVHKYVGAEGILPRIDRLGGSSWENRKRRVRKAVERMARELLQLYAAREVTPGYAFSPLDESYQEFEGTFPYEETPDQRRAIEEVMEDMGASRPMDRLVCGDVGFGKTEIAIRAAFRAVMDGKQVVYLVPTTILAEQHYQTFMERFRSYPVLIEVLSRFRTSKEQRQILQRCREGKVDILIGTHRLLQKDFEISELGLFITDEEHRFGVAHKERLKKIRKEVDVLTLTATPIPRTLHMAMLGIRDLSIIETPPPERLSIRTVVANFERDLVCEAVQREMTRGGQIFFVHNRVQGIERIAAKLSEWLPAVRIGIAHGQMPERELARVMESYHRGDIDLLVCTTIIQSGLDVPKANTILVNNAHHLGLAEMYQIRGRVGRAGHQAYAYLLIPEQLGGMTPDAAKRLQTLQEFSELGAGFRIATRDLEIRGAGTLLGPSQSGHIDAVGFELYTQLMRRAIAGVKGESMPTEIEPEINLPVHAYVPETYVPDSHMRLGLYRRLSRVDSEEQIHYLREEIEDRFGPLPEEGENLLQLIGLRCLLRSMGVTVLKMADGRLQVTFHPTTPLSPQGLIRFVQDRADKGLRFISEHTLEFPLGWYADEPIIALAQRGLKGLLQDASIGA